MLSDKQLERVSASYRRGYRDGFAGKPKSTPETGISTVNNDTIGGTIKPFANFDYDSGYAAGKNDARWNDNHRRDYGGAFDGFHVSSDADPGL